MNLEHWKAILGTYRQGVALIEKLLPPGSPVKPERLQYLQEQLIEELFKLQRTLSANLRANLVEDLTRPLTYFFDEFVLRRLEDKDPSLWPMLQKHFFNLDWGGDHFYEFTEEKLRQPDTPSLVFEVLHFCLSAGFVGRYANWPAKILDYMKELASRIARPAPVPQPPPPPPAEPVKAYESPLPYYLTTGFVIVLLPVVLWWLSNH